MSTHHSTLFAIAAVGAFATAGCLEAAPDSRMVDLGADAELFEQDPIRSPDTPGTSATAMLSPTEGSDVEGSIVFATTGQGTVRIEGEISGLSPGPHGFHVHENGDCSAADASSAGDHFAPGGNPHGSPTDGGAERHVGDLGNLEANAEGIADVDQVDRVITLEGPESIVGKALIVHQMADDFETQPDGDAGPRRACGVIMAARN
jgi:superoxide dismutase, Cu-Zn family